MEKALAKKIAAYMVNEGTENTSQGNWIFDHSEIEEIFNVKLDDEAIKQITDAILEHEEVEGVWGKEETGEDVFDINFWLDYCPWAETDEDDDEEEETA